MVIRLLASDWSARSCFVVTDFGKEMNRPFYSRPQIVCIAYVPALLQILSVEINRHMFPVHK